MNYELFMTTDCAKILLKDGTFCFAFHNGKVRKISVNLISRGNAIDDA